MQCEDVKIYIVYSPADYNGDNGGILGAFTIKDKAIESISDPYNKIVEVVINKPVTSKFNLMEGEYVWEINQKL
jgi:hypothetical protein